MKEENFETQFGKSFERIGKGLGRMIDNLSVEKNASEKSIWEDDAQKDDIVQKVLSYFIANAGKTIPAERVDEMTIQKVLEWVDKHATPFVDKVYIIKGYHSVHKKYIFCVFFGSGDSIYIKESDPQFCFITSKYNDEMKQTFENNEICIIPLK